MHNLCMTSPYKKRRHCKPEMAIRVNKTCKYYQIPCTDPSGKFIMENCPETPLPMYSQSGKYKNFTKIKADFTTDDKCPVLSFPYNMINFWKSFGPGRSSISTFDMELLTDIVQYTTRPRFILNLVNRFIPVYLK